jgi:hypothetical protein
MYPWLDDGWNLYGECLDENLPRRFLSKQAERMHEKEELGRVRGLIRNWCRSVGVPWTPDAQKSKDENLAEWRVGLAECLQSHEAADIIKSRETVEKACVEHPEERTAKPQVDTLICLQDKEPTRRMYREWDLARRAAIFKKQ